MPATTPASSVRAIGATDIAALSAWADDQPGIAGALVLLSHPLLVRKMGGCWDVARRSIDWEKLESRCWSRTEVLLFEAARCLASGVPCDLGRLTRGLDPEPWRWLCAALAVARGELRLGDVLGCPSPPVPETRLGPVRVSWQRFAITPSARP